MTRLILTLLLILATLAPLSGCGNDRRLSRPDGAAISAPRQEIYGFSLESIDGEVIDLERYRGQHVLLVNVASRCGFTPQYAELQQLHEQYGDRVAVLGFPANDFMGQEPGSNTEIAEFCEKNYGVSFQMFAKITVTGEEKHPLYQWLSTAGLNGWNEQAPTWNFCKYLVGPDGRLLKYYGSMVSPLDPELIEVIDSEHQGPREVPAAPEMM